MTFELRLDEVPELDGLALLDRARVAWNNPQLSAQDVSVWNKNAIYTVPETVARTLPAFNLSSVAFAKRRAYFHNMPEAEKGRYVVVLPRKDSAATVGQVHLAWDWRKMLEEDLLELQ